MIPLGSYNHFENVKSECILKIIKSKYYKTTVRKSHCHLGNKRK
jgi:hypothetical protein